MDYYEPRDDLDDPPLQHPDEPSPIQKVYEGACIFVTGGTGFMGKVLIEKLLRTCNVAKIYIMVRDKKGVKSQDRLPMFLDDKLFEPLKLQKPGEVAKVSIVTGDCSLPDLGLNEADRTRMSDVNIVFHAAATLYMDQHLKVAYVTNVLATKYLLEFAKSLPRLQAFIYVSTAYTHAYRDRVDEKFYEVVLDEGDLGELCNNLDDAQIGSLTPTLTGRWGNTYALTKACAENLISKYDGVIPIGIVRPSIVISTCDEPLKGWINNLYGPMGVVVGTGLGAVKVWCADWEMVADVIPVDIVINMMLAATWEVVTNNSQIKIYNCVSSSKNPINWSSVLNSSFTLSSGLHSTLAIGVPSLHAVTSKLLFNIYSIWYHLIPGVFFDMFLKISGKSPQLSKLYAKVYNVNKSLMPYCVDKPIEFTSDNVNRLWEILDPVDKTLFNFDLNALNWNSYWLHTLKGVRVYLLNDPMETIPEGCKLRFKLQLRTYLFNSLIWSGITSVFYYIFKDTASSLFVN